jgi:hypothetical protein
MLQQQTKPGSSFTRAKRHSGDPSIVPILKLTRNGTTIQELPLDGPQVLIGRADDNDLSIPTQYVSQHHILLVRQDGHTTLIDLHSTNGTFVNSERVSKHVLTDHDVITVDRRSMFVTNRIEYSEPASIADSSLDYDGPTDPEIEKIAARFESLLSGGDTDVLPDLSEDVPTIVGVIDDR